MSRLSFVVDIVGERQKHGRSDAVLEVANPGSQQSTGQPFSYLSPMGLIDDDDGSGVGLGRSRGTRRCKICPFEKRSSIYTSREVKCFVRRIRPLNPTPDSRRFELFFLLLFFLISTLRASSSYYEANQLTLQTICV